MGTTPLFQCSAAIGSSVLVVVVVGVVVFASTAFGVWWQRLIGRRLTGSIDRRRQTLTTTDPTAAARVDAIASRLRSGIRFTETMWRHPWLTALTAAIAAMLLFSAIFAVGALTQPDSCVSAFVTKVD